MEKWKQQLEKVLLPIGGQEITFPPFEEDLNKILNRGKEHSVKNRTFMKGAMSQCHFNTSRLWDANRDQVQIATGYALYQGRWIQHSWGLQKNRVVETTLPFEKYFGFLLTDDEANDFYFDNA